MLLYKSGLKGALEAASVESAKDFYFAQNTTYGLGGAARAAFFPRTVWEAKKIYNSLLSRGMPIQIVGNGSNILASDCGFEGAVISTKNLSGIFRISKDKILCLAGTKVATLLKYCKDNRLGGLEYLSGIPATLGGAAYMNAGISGTAIAGNILNVHIFDGKSSVLDNEKCNFGYRQSTMRDINAIILSIILKVEPCNLELIEQRLKYYQARRSCLPKGKSCGCVFKNPNGDSAGKIIEQAGLKGMRIGNAEVSSLHANFIINYGTSAQDVKELISFVKRSVAEKFDILLEEEVVYIGDFYDTDG